MEKFKYLDYPEDLRVQIFGKTQEDLFINAALAMMTYLYPHQVEFMDDEVHEKIKITANTTEELIFNWLNDILYLSNEKDVCYNNFNFKIISEKELSAKIYGRRVRAKNDIKKIISEDIKITKDKDGYRTEIIFDI